MKKYYQLLLISLTVSFLASCRGSNPGSSIITSSAAPSSQGSSQSDPANQLTLTLDANGGVFSNGESTMQIKVIKSEKTTIPETPTKDNYEFSYWANGTDLYSRWSPDGTWTAEQDETIYAHWLGKKVNVVVESSNDDRESCYVNDTKNGGEYRIGQEVRISAYPKEGYALEGWYIDDELYSTETIFDYIVPQTNVKFVAKFWTTGEEAYRNIGASLAYHPETKTYTYGTYPQNWVGSEMTETLTKDAKSLGGGYYEYDNRLFLLACSDSDAESYKFDDGTQMESNKDYYFECKAVSWKEVSSSEGKHYIVSEKILDCTKYADSYAGTQEKTDYKGEKDTVYANNYKYSAIRTWLNKDLFNNLFIYGSSNIVLTDVVNDAESTSKVPNEYVCANTQDKVAIPSLKEMKGADSCESGLTTTAKTTDYARAIGASSSNEEERYGNGTYWTRSPCENNYERAYCVTDYGSEMMGAVSRTFYGVRPAVTIEF